MIHKSLEFSLLKYCKIFKNVKIENLRLFEQSKPEHTNLFVPL